AAIPLLDESIINADTEPAHVDVYHHWVILTDDAGDPAGRLHRVQAATLLNLEDTVATTPRDRRSIGANAGGGDPDDWAAIRIDVFFASTEHQLGGNEAIEAGGDERLRCRNRVFLGEIFLGPQLRNLGPPPRNLFGIEVMKLGELGLLAAHLEIAAD